ncbi:MAG: DEAD/DEAH box helicase, partial [Deltaproteobacteria bacterium]|nr:DEAD/DEAH box helicase [Deltaproteobacteria bacterium]
MIALHAVWANDLSLRIWAEDPERRSAASILDALQRMGCTLPREAPKEAALTLLVPTGDDGLEPCTVPSLSFDPTQALDLLVSLPERPMAGVAISEGVRVLREVARLALEIAARGKVVPGLVERGKGFEARWLPVIADAEDQRRRHLLAQALPASCRAEITPDLVERGRRARKKVDWSALPVRSAAAVVDDALGALVDACARDAVRGAGLDRVKKHGSDRVAASWLKALAAPDPKLRWARSELASLGASLRAWQDPALHPTGAFRTCFRVSSPEQGGDGDSWNVEFLLQAADDPSLLVPAADVWKTRGRTLTVLRRRLSDPQERLLADLGRAARLWPGIEVALRTARPSSVTLDATGAHGFLREAAPLLEQAGFGLIAPSWWGRPAARLGIKARARAAPREDRGQAGLLGMNGIVDVDWILALGDERISLDELKRLAALKVPLVQVRGQWVEVRREDIDKALAFLEKGAPTGMSIPEIMRLGLGAEPSPAGLPFVGVEAEGELGDLVRGEMDIEPCSTPEGFGGKLRPYQERGLAWLAFLGQVGLGACLADDMGLGKTVQLLALLVDERNRACRGMAPGPTLLVCPMSVIGNWQAETARFAPCLRVLTHHGTERAQGEDFADAALGADLVLTTYALAARDKGTLARVLWHRVVLDEAQNIKNPAAQQARAVRELEAKRRVAMTGTPVEN